MKIAVRPAGSTPEELGAELRKDYERYGNLVRTLNIRMD